MGGMAAVAIDQLMQSRAGRWTFLVLGLGSLLAGGLIVDAENARHQAAIERREASQRLWFAECTKPVDECAVAWDASYTLRELYRERVSP
jgi:hypothetical protein